MDGIYERIGVTWIHMDGIYERIGVTWIHPSRAASRVGPPRRVSEGRLITGPLHALRHCPGALSSYHSKILRYKDQDCLFGFFLVFFWVYVCVGVCWAMFGAPFVFDCLPSLSVERHNGTWPKKFNFWTPEVWVPLDPPPGGYPGPWGGGGSRPDYPRPQGLKKKAGGVRERGRG